MTSPDPATDPAPEPPAPPEPPQGAPRPRPPGASPISGTPPPVSTRWKKGQSGNPGGRPKGLGITAALRELAATEHGGKPIAALIAERMVKEALSGKFNFAKEVIDRLDGKVPDKHQVESKTQGTVFVCRPPRVIGEAESPRALPPLPALPEDEPEGG